MQSQSRLLHSSDSDVVEFMTELASYLLAAGITSSRFQKIAKQAYFHAAARHAKFRNQRVNQSAIAATTGLTRVQIRKFAKTGRKPPDNSDRLDSIMRGWASDPQFTTSEFLPRPLTLKGRGAGFSLLVKKYGGNRLTKPVMRELIRLGLAESDGMLIRVKPSPSKQRAHLQQLLRLLHKFIDCSKDVPKKSLVRTVIREISYPSSSLKGRQLLNRYAIHSIEAFMSELQSAGRAASIETPSRSPPVQSRTRLLMVTEELTRRGQPAGKKHRK
jgi:hypothetical protein